MNKLFIFCLFLVVTMSATILVDQDSNGRLNGVTIQEKGKTPLKVMYSYVQGGLSMVISGNKALLPTYAELLSIIDAKFIQRVEQKTISIFKFNNAIQASGTYNIWTPATGKRFCLMGFVIILPAGLTSAAANSLLIQDSLGNVLYAANICSAAMAALPTPIILADVNYPNGVLGIVPDATLNLVLQNNLGAAITISAWGTEE